MDQIPSKSTLESLFADAYNEVLLGCLELFERIEYVHRFLGFEPWAAAVCVKALYPIEIVQVLIIQSLFFLRI
jgi:hypothetical protein